MALVKCPDCGHDISDRAPACVNCGAPMAAPAPPVEVCEVVLRRIHGLGIIGGARWILEGQVMTPQGITVVASCQYSSDNELANFQGSKREFHKARETITNQLLRAGWEPLASLSGGDAMSLPRFQRRAGVERERLLQGTQGTGSGGVIVTRIYQRTGANLTYDVLVDGVKVTKLRPGTTARLDLPPGNHTIQFTCMLAKSDVFEVRAEAGGYTDLSCGLTPGLMTNKFMLRGSDGSSLSPADKGKPFMA
jgi:hypothetical protein